ncbi:protein of unknown function [Clostridium beijerinckii]|nr:protein of unknown function [Clostridium beijerinckii]
MKIDINIYLKRIFLILVFLKIVIIKADNNKEQINLRIVFAKSTGINIASHIITI